jgi:hypothetical protein
MYSTYTQSESFIRPVFQSYLCEVPGDCRPAALDDLLPLLLKEDTDRIEGPVAHYTHVCRPVVALQVDVHVIAKAVDTWTRYLYQSPW